MKKSDQARESGQKAELWSLTLPSLSQASLLRYSQTWVVASDSHYYTGRVGLSASARS